MADLFSFPPVENFSGASSSGGGIDWAKIIPWLIMGGGSVGNAIIGSKSAGKSTEAMLAGAEKAALLEKESRDAALNFQKEAFNKSIALQYPHIQLGQKALAPLGKGMGFAPPEGGYQAPSLQSLMFPTTSTNATAPTPSSAGNNLSSAMLSADANPAMKGTSTLKGLVGGGLMGAGLGASGLGIASALGAATGPMAPFVIGGAALAGGLASLVGRGRKEADKIVPYQNALTQKVHEIEAMLQQKSESGSLTEQDWNDAIATVSQLKNEFDSMTQDFGRAGPGARNSTSWIADAITGWNSRQLRPVQPRMHGGPVRGGKYVVGEDGPEILEMAPGAEGWVYPNASLKALTRLPGRQAGGPVNGGIWWMNPELNNFAPKMADPPTSYPSSPVTGTSSAINPYNPSVSYLQQPDGTQRNSQNGQYYDANGMPLPFNADLTQRLDQSSYPSDVNYQPPAAILGSTLRPSTATDVTTGEPGESGAVPAILGSTLENHMLPGGDNKPFTGTLASVAGSPTTTTSTNPQVSRDTFDKSTIQQWGWSRNADDTWTNVNGDKGRWLTDGRFLNVSQNMVFDPATGKVTPYSGGNTQNPYEGMPAPYEPTEGEFLRPFDQSFTGTVDKQPFHFDATTMFDDPGYQFRFNEGTKALERSASARGTLKGGRTLKELTRYAQDYASGEFDKAYNRAFGENQLSYGRDVDAYNRALNEYRQAFDIFTSNRDSRFNKLQAIAGGSQVASSTLGSSLGSVGNTGAQIISNSGTNQAQLQTDIANAIAAGDMARAQSLMAGLDSASQMALMWQILGRK